MSRRWPTTASAHLPARLDGLWRLAAPALRPGGQQPDGLGLHHRRGLPQERRHALAADGSRRRHRPRLCGRPRSRPRELVHNEAFNVGRPPRTTGSASSPRSWPKSCPNSRVDFADDASPDKRNYRVDCNKIARTLPASSRSGRCAAASSSSTMRSCAVGLTLDDFEGASSSASRTSSS